MLSVKQALDLIMGEAEPVSTMHVNLSSVLGRVLRHDVLSLEDSPPFAKAMMDGFGMRYEDVIAGKREFLCVRVITAGMNSTEELLAGQAVQIMTGAAVPPGVELIVPIELTGHDGRVSPCNCDIKIKTDDFRRGQHILPRGGNYRQGQVIVPGGRRTRAQELAALCEAGINQLEVSREVTVAVLATGNELVNPVETPSAGEIRNSNEPMLLAQIRQAYGIGKGLGIAIDELEAIRNKVQAGLNEDILLLTGGVSAGTLDLVPQVLSEAGVREVLHKVSLKPGKPVWYGVRATDAKKTHVFGLPGNPVSSMICFELFVKPLIKKLAGLAEIEATHKRAVVKQSYCFRSDRPTYHPVRCYWEQGMLQAEILKWTGSSDLTSTVLANGTGVFAAGERVYQSGEVIDVMLWE